MRKSILSTAIVAGLALGVAMGCTAQADSSTQASESAAPGSMSSSGPAATPQNAFEAGQAEIAAATARLEAEFAKQFQQAAVERASLEKMIADVVQAYPEPARLKVKLHIDEVIETGRQLAPKMTPEERGKAVAPTPMEKLGKTQQHLIAGWGWGSGLGFGGFGAFGFPAAAAYYGSPGYYYGSPWYGDGFYGTGFGCGLAGAWCGTGLGLGGWYI